MPDACPDTLPAAAPAAPPCKWLLSVAYDGSGYGGWQIQPDKPTVQAALQEALAKLFRAPCAIAGCSRTDTGVHALGQLAEFVPPRWPPIAPEAAVRALKDLLPPDVRVRAIREIEPGFSVREAPRAKAYTYVYHRGELATPFLWRYCTPVPAVLDEAAMRQAAAALLGTHDYRAFGVRFSRTPERDPVKTLYAWHWRQDGPFLAFSVIGSSFLYRMVRRLAGFFLAVGQGKLAPAAAARVLAGEPLSFETAAPQGLYLEEIFLADDFAAWQPGPLPFLALLDPPRKPGP